MGFPVIQMRRWRWQRGISLYWADHDDLLEPDALSRMMEVLEQDPGTDDLYR